MKQQFQKLLVFACLSLFCQVYCGVINDKSSLPESLASASVNNGTRSGRVIYTGSYSNVRVSSHIKEPKSLLEKKYYPIPSAVFPKKPVLPGSMKSDSAITSLLTQTPTSPHSPASTTEEIQTEPVIMIPAQVEEKTLIPDLLEFIEESEPIRDEDEPAVIDSDDEN